MVGILKAADWPWPESDTRWLETWASKSKHDVGVFARALVKVYGRQAGRQLTVQELCSVFDPELAKVVRKPRTFEGGGLQVTFLGMMRELGIDVTAKELEQYRKDAEERERARGRGEDEIPE